MITLHSSRTWALPLALFLLHCTPAEEVTDPGDGGLPDGGCMQGEQLVDGVCVPDVCVGDDCPSRCVESDGSLKDCDDGNECTFNECDEETGFCLTVDKSDGAECNEDVGICISGECEVACEKDEDCYDGDDCTDDTCYLAGGHCPYDDVADDTLCDGGLGVCISGECRTSCDEDADCDDEDEDDCTVYACDTELSICAEEDEQDGEDCISDGENPGRCTDGVCRECDEDEDCDDLNDCTINTCNSQYLCSYEEKAVDVSCETEDALDGTCQGDPRVCVAWCEVKVCDVVECKQPGKCNDDTGACDYDPVPDEPPTLCDDDKGKCVDGACEDLCKDVPCNGTDGCTGTCELGSCNWTETNGDVCPGVDPTGTCVDGVCEPDPPKVEVKYPLDGATNIALDVEPWATFDRPIDGNSVDDTTFYLTKRDSTDLLAAYLSIDLGDQPTIRLNPDDALDGGTWYTVTIDGVEDLAGRPLNGYSWSFMTGY